MQHHFKDYLCESHFVMSQMYSQQYSVGLRVIAKVTLEKKFPVTICFMMNFVYPILTQHIQRMSDIIRKTADYSIKIHIVSLQKVTCTLKVKDLIRSLKFMIYDTSPIITYVHLLLYNEQALENSTTRNTIQYNSLHWSINVIRHTLLLYFSCPSLNLT